MAEDDCGGTDIPSKYVTATWQRRERGGEAAQGTRREAGSCRRSPHARTQESRKCDEWTMIDQGE
eukprot:CAMPEP_0194780076 /NCGR_PEP_ID=MMETSP0323_2-20130528/72722_1 /TAXON_ID=2866 ORGANISM="Crypthecodinium cohnii, Strain Seligo" /NCGR_SAMPLE_ID=MMETSP0323_2 /ASSEMBLY_ACC=CAM_ASM_000346 /LENGTH=64 /DNA_ID=CAMNT_0039717953 /DNA_START=233 /DNA_END=427 /DNA_ORIENTATION=+